MDFPGCGTFHKSASFVAFNSTTGEAAGMVLSSFVSVEAGHISQLCVMPNFRGSGLGNEALCLVGAEGRTDVQLEQQRYALLLIARKLLTTKRAISAMTAAARRKGETRG